MSKSKKIVIIVLASIVALLAIALIVCRNVIPEQTQAFLNSAWEFVNAPLPLIGISILAVTLLLWRFFLSTSFGKRKYNELKKDYEALKEEYKEVLIIVSRYNQKQEELKEEFKKVSENTIKYITNIRDKIPNARVKGIEYGQEETNNETKAN